MDKQNDYHTLQNEAKAKPFIGNTLTTNSVEEIQIVIVCDAKAEIIWLNGLYQGQEMMVDGQNNYIKLTCPINTTFYVRL